MTYLKLFYYALFAGAYGTVGSFCSLVLVNSSWTYCHTRSLWWFAALTKRIHVLYPPCRIASKDATLSVKSKEKEAGIVLSIGQFRPEKDHQLQIEAIALLLQQHPELKKDVKLIVVGSCRGKSDEERLQHLQDMVEKLHLTASIDFVVNQPYSVVEEWLCKASVGIHTMWNEHFGIGVVEMMAAGLITIAHNSGGPRSDIVVPLPENGQPTGLLASTPQEYADAIYKAFSMEQSALVSMRRNAISSAERFSDEIFNVGFKRRILESKLLT